MYKAVIKLFGKKGIKFTMDDLAKELKISKKTIYVHFKDKETLFLATVDYLFDSIKEEEQLVAEDVKLTTVEKLEKIMGVLPDSYKDINFAELYVLKDKYPKIYKRVEKRLENGWEITIALLEKGMLEGTIRRIPVPIFKTMFEATLEQFFQQNVLVKNKISYGKALQEVIEILLYGVTVRNS
ncbi:MAG: TetR/AcrR family transcriptional regulator [Eubacterium sp.]|nr:TetR/AcrR family transcriptional regulator [Eubacterium sp.]